MPPLHADPSAIFEASALDRARLLRCYSWQDVADRSLLSRTTLTKLRGGVQPSAAAVEALAEALAVPTSFLRTRPTAAPTPEVLHFRKRTSAPKKRLEQLLARGALLQAVVTGLRRGSRAKQPLLQFPLPADASPPDSAPLPASNAIDAPAIEGIAAQCRAAWDIAEQEPIAHVCRLLENAGVWLATFAADDVAVDGFSWFADQAFVMYALGGSPTRTRFSLLHELGHLIMHRDSCTGDVLKEREANHFAGAMLLPAKALQQEFPRRGEHLDWEGLVQLKQRWGSSLQAIVQRARVLDIIGAATYRWAYIHINQRGWRRNEPAEPDDYERPQRVAAAVAQRCRQRGIEPAQLAAELQLPTDLLVSVFDAPSASVFDAATR